MKGKAVRVEPVPGIADSSMAALLVDALQTVTQVCCSAPRILSEIEPPNLLNPLVNLDRHFFCKPAPPPPSIYMIRAVP